jgi:hypothetical protein
MIMQWFGPSWPSGICDECPQVHTPVGQPCSHCDEPIVNGDSGIVYSNGPVAHRNCFLRQSIGSVAHLRKRCSCYVPGSTEFDPPNMTRRQAADEAVRLWEKMQARSN